MPDGRKWGSVSAVSVDTDGKHVWAGDRCGANSCAGSKVDPIVKLDPSGKVVKSFGAGQILWPHGMDVDKQGNVWVVDARSASEAELKQYPDAAGKGHTVTKFSPDGKVLLVLGTPGKAGNPPEAFTEPNDVIVAPDGSIFVAEAHNAQFLDAEGPGAIGRISKFSPDGKFLKSFGSFGFGNGQFRGPHALAFDSKGRLFVADRGNRRLQIFDQDGKHLDTLVPVQPHQRPQHYRRRYALRHRFGVGRQLQPRLAKGVAGRQCSHRRGLVLRARTRLEAGLRHGRLRFNGRGRHRGRRRECVCW